MEDVQAHRVPVRAGFAGTFGVSLFPVNVTRRLSITGEVIATVVISSISIAIVLVLMRLINLSQLLQQFNIPAPQGAFTKSESTFDGLREEYRCLIVLEVLLVPALVLTVLYFRRVLWELETRRRRSYSFARCEKCGYDLRGTWNRCPECGTMPKHGSEPKVESILR